MVVRPLKLSAESLSEYRSSAWRLPLCRDAVRIKAQADVLLSRLHLCLPGWRAAEGRRRRAEQQFDWQEAARARGLEWDGRGTDSADFDEPQGAHRHH